MNILIYPLGEWIKIASRTSERADDLRLKRVLLFLNRHGVKTEIDGQGKILRPKEFKGKTNSQGEIVVEGKRTI